MIRMCILWLLSLGIFLPAAQAQETLGTIREAGLEQRRAAFERADDVRRPGALGRAVE